MANVLETSVWAKEHSRALIIGSIAVVAVALFAFFYISNRRSREERAATELTPLRALVQSGQTQNAINGLQTYLNSYGRTRSAAEARLLIGQEYLASGQPQKAIEAVDPIDDDLAAPTGINAALLAAAAYETAQEPHKAEEIYLRVGDEAPYDFQKQDALDNVGRLRLARGDAAGAAQIYQRLLDATPEANPAHQIWQLRLAEAQTAAYEKPGS